MLVVACLLLTFSTAHLVIDIIRIIQGLIFSRGIPGGPDNFFGNVSHWTFVYKNYIYTAQTLVGDGLYRCWVVYQSKVGIILPVILWIGVAVTGIATPYVCSIAVKQHEVFGGTLSLWITAWWACAFSENLLSTMLLAFRIWYVDTKTSRIQATRKSQLRPVLRVIIDAGAIYSVTLLIGLICFVTRSTSQYVVLDTVTPIISITFYMVIIRVGLANRAIQTGASVPLSVGYASIDTSAERRRRMHVQVTTLTESKTDDGSFPAAMTCDSVDANELDVRGSDFKFDSVGHAV
ncbi:hypothetical protein JVU11DRAFT_10272 [Chiua virens]|nr:hypothetical protein JVU11DRAFT_10272 [Chiua virens]